MYALVKDGEVQETAGALPHTWRLADGRRMSNFHRAKASVHKAEGWLPIEKAAPTYDPEYERLVFDHYEVRDNKVRAQYRAMVIPKPEPTPDVRQFRRSLMDKLGRRRMNELCKEYPLLNEVLVGRNWEETGAVLAMVEEDEAATKEELDTFRTLASRYHIPLETEQ